MVRINYEENKELRLKKYYFEFKRIFDQYDFVYNPSDLESFINEHTDSFYQIYPKCFYLKCFQIILRIEI